VRRANLCRTLGSFFSKDKVGLGLASPRSPQSTFTISIATTTSHIARRRTSRHHVQIHAPPPKDAPAAPALPETSRHRILQGKPRGENGHDKPLRKLHARLEQDTDICLPRTRDPELRGALNTRLAALRLHGAIQLVEAIRLASRSPTKA
jgi:hypothetical protein